MFSWSYISDCNFGLISDSSIVKGAKVFFLILTFGTFFIPPVGYASFSLRALLIKFHCLKKEHGCYGSSKHMDCIRKNSVREYAVEFTNKNAKQIKQIKTLQYKEDKGDFS